MDVYLGTDRMLAYFDTSGHDDQTLRETHGLRPAPEYLAWAISKGIFAEDTDKNIIRGENWGKPEIFCSNKSEFQRLQESVPAFYGFENAGPRPSNKVSRLTKANQAIAREAIYANLEPNKMGDIALRTLATNAADKEAHLNDAELGAQLNKQTSTKLKPEHNDVQIVISDGLSAEAVHHNIPELLPVLLDGLNSRKLNIGQPILAPFGRVKLAESIGDALQAQLVVTLIGERPGGDALASRSMSAYFAYRLTDDATQKSAANFSGNANMQYEYSVLSNIYAGGLPPIEAGSVIAEKVFDILKFKAAGNRLENLLQQSS
jgi:ethanolamine ammonia-lyase large subunit